MPARAKYSVPMAAGLAYNYGAKAVDDEVLSVLAKLAKEEIILSKVISKEDIKEEDIIVVDNGWRYKIYIDGVTSEDIDMLVRLKQLSYIKIIKSIIVTQFVLGIISAIIAVIIMLSI